MLNESTSVKGYEIAPIPEPCEKQIRAVFEMVMSRGIGCIEMRTFGSSSSEKFEDRLPKVGFYDDLEAFVRDALANHAKATVCFGKNLRKPVLLHSQKANFLVRGKDNGGKKDDILSRNFFGIDIDTKRPSSKVAASGMEMKAARNVYDAVGSEFNSKGIDFVPAFSGNGMHLNVFTVPYPISSVLDEKNGLFALLLRSLQRRFGDSSGEIDLGVYDPGRVWKLYGTAAVKGGNTVERPWRTARMEIPNSWPKAIDLLAVYESEIKEQREFEAQGARTVSRRPKMNLLSLFKGE